MNEIPTIANLRKLAELNFGPECYKKYLALIEPGIKSIIENYVFSTSQPKLDQLVSDPFAF